MIHKTAIIDPKAKISKDVKIGPYTVIGPNVEIGDNTIIQSHVSILAKTIIGKGNKIYPFVSINEPQDLKYKGESTELIIGDNNEELHNDCFLIFVVNYFFIAGICKDFAMGFPGGCTSLGSSCIKRNIHIGASWKYL